MTFRDKAPYLFGEAMIGLVAVCLGIAAWTIPEGPLALRLAFTLMCLLLAGGAAWAFQDIWRDE